MQPDWEMTMVMPLGVLANQLVKIESDLRFLSMKATELSSDDGVPCMKAIDARLELIHDAMDSIASLLVRLRADMQPKGSASLRQRSAGEKRSPERDD